MRQILFEHFMSVALLLGAGTAFGNNGYYDKYHQNERGFAFALVGDGPYGEDQETKWDETIRQINRDRDVKFVIHAGDIKGRASYRAAVSISWSVFCFCGWDATRLFV